MAWKPPKVDWTPVDPVSEEDFNRIEGNTEELNEMKVDKGCTWGDLKGATTP